MRKPVSAVLGLFTNSILLIYQMEFVLARVLVPGTPFIQHTHTFTRSHIYTGVSLRHEAAVQSIHFTIFRVCIIEPLYARIVIIFFFGILYFIVPRYEYIAGWWLICIYMNAVRRLRKLRIVYIYQHIYVGWNVTYSDASTAASTHAFIVHTVHIRQRKKKNSTCTLVSVVRRCTSKMQNGLERDG